MDATQDNRPKSVIRPAQESDCAALTELMMRSNAYEGRYRSIIANYPVTPAMVRTGETWVIEHEGEIAGFYRLDIAGAELDLMFVDDRRQGSGVGRMLFEHMLAVAAENGLTVVKIVSHPPTVEFYRRMGATEIGVSRAKQPDGWDRPVLQLAVT